jgi:hypothetical protein
MLSSPRLNNNEQKPIPIEASSTVLQIVLDSMHETRLTANSMSWPDCKAAYIICQTYECKIPTERLRGLMLTIVKKAPWEIFVIASHANDIILAISAIASMRQDHKHRQLDHIAYKTEICSQPAVSFSVSLAIAMALCRGSRQNLIPYGTCLDWAKVAEEFGIHRAHDG